MCLNRTDFLASFQPTKEYLVAKIAQMIRDPVSAEVILARVDKVLEYNVAGGKLQRGLTLVNTYEATKRKGHEIPMEKICRLGWIVELIQACFLVTDDIMDDGITRRGKPCWYKVEEIGLSAANDALLLEACVDTIIREDFGDHPAYARLCNLVQIGKMITILGQTVDNETRSLSECTPQRYREQVRLKTSHYTFYLPVHIGLHLNYSEKEADELTKMTESICYNIGHLFQSQDDFLDCFGQQEMTGKTSRDIQEGKCTWPLVNALSQLATNDPLRNEIQDCYGKEDDGLVLRVRAVYAQLKVKEKFEEFEKCEFDKITSEINQLNEGGLRELLHNTLSSLIRRQY